MADAEPSRRGRRTRPLRAADRPLRAADRPARRQPKAEPALSLPPARAEERAVLEEATRLMSLLAMDAYAEKLASELSYGTLRLLELGCMLALRPQLLLLDEPASGISQKETESLGPLLRRIKEQTGATMLVIEHDIPLIMSLSDWVYCLDAGANLSEGTPAAVQA